MGNFQLLECVWMTMDDSVKIWADGLKPRSSMWNFIWKLVESRKLSWNLIQPLARGEQPLLPLDVMLLPVPYRPKLSADGNCFSVFTVNWILNVCFSHRTILYSPTSNPIFSPVLTRVSADRVPEDSQMNWYIGQDLQDSDTEGSILVEFWVLQPQFKRMCSPTWSLERMLQRF